MSQNCEHPFCIRFIATKCSNHCQLELCQEHLIEHKNLFLAQYQKSFNNLHKSLNDLVNSMEETKKTLDDNYQKDVSVLNENHHKQLNEAERKFLFVNVTQKLIKEKRQLLTDVKNDQAFLYQYDIEQIKLYLTTMQEYHRDKIETKTEIGGNDCAMSLSWSSDVHSDIEDIPKLKTNTNNEYILKFRGQCPLNRHGIYGLTNKHNLRLCSSKKQPTELCLIKHFHRYHHLTQELSFKLTKAILNKFDPITTRIFPPNTDLIDQYYHPIKCPLNKLKFANKCESTFFRDSLKKHLLSVHQLSLSATMKIITTFRNQGDLTQVNLNENEFKKKGKK
ncbi:unnamed protein product [Rotaria magnacalcarata]|uniref:Uncharacterized protein n=3 Tax=Rotaria magnacalcarata TaxID=392030 RepID=A0A815ESU7_9BILA|nr:unnamed protein product [Rotaria magnacalcarata]CAF1464468.1 unnamed protein product [Rotaria magnacalcarata]CAF2152986.1 unnamed protein product [Rotaria magnacalcarata]CAF3892080.1 unnamed protein product [Rotaria magnacalcarata]CAF3952260.1 unnamed protein product [Rotaria magnacalcarata]